MPQTDSHAAQDGTLGANGGSTLHDLFALTDEQILEIEPEVERPGLAPAVISSEARNLSSFDGADAARLSKRDSSLPSVPPFDSVQGGRNDGIGQSAPSAAATSHDGQVTHHDAQPPAWLAAQMKDPWTGQEAQELWNGVQQAKSEAAAYRAAFATPEDARALKELYTGGVNEARAVAERARLLDDIDRSYFGAAGNSAEQTSAARVQLAQTLLREDPAAFREMVFAGLRALENNSRVGANPGSSGNDVVGTSASMASLPEQASPAPTAVSAIRAQHPDRVGTGAAPQQVYASPLEAHVAAYAAFERAANEDLERSVGTSIERTIQYALPNLSRSNEVAGVGARSVVPLQNRLSAAVRQDVEAALKGDRQLGEQIAQILSARRFDNETRAQVVRLIGERAQQLIPGAAKRVLNDWTQTTLAAHRGRTARADAASARREVAPASGEPPRGIAVNQHAATNRSARSDAGKTPSVRVDYRKLSDEQILDL